MKQLALDIGLWPGPTLNNFYPGLNVQALEYLHSVADEGRGEEMASSVPVYLWGQRGVGKSHLLRAMQQALCAQGACVGWLNASDPAPAAFDEHWIAVLLDDVHLYTQAQQAVAFNWCINAINPPIGASRLVLAAGLVPPTDLPLRDDLRTRLGWGHVFQLHLLSEAGCRNVLYQQALERGITLSAEVLDYMLGHLPRDLGHLAQLLERLDGFALRTQRSVTIPLLKTMLETE